jgi:hypothetical protein
MVFQSEFSNSKVFAKVRNFLLLRIGESFALLTQQQSAFKQSRHMSQQPIETTTVEIEPPVELEKVSERVQTLIQRGNVTWTEYENLRLNGFERDALYPVLTTEALCKATEQVRSFCLPQRHFPTLTYDETLTHRLVPLLVADLLRRVRTEAAEV